MSLQHLAARLTWPQVKLLAQSEAVALLPVGSTEAHGPHLPLSVDVVIAEEVCRRVALRLAAKNRASVTFPALAYTLTDFAAAFSGTVSVQADTARALLRGVLEGIAQAGFGRVLVCNHHLEPAHFKLVHEAAAEARAARRAKIAVADHRRRPHGPRLGEEFMHGGSHAGGYETSLMMAAAPQLVDEAVRRALPELKVDLPARIKAGAKDFLECGGDQAYFGAPAAATADEGNRLFDILAEVSEAALEDEG
jgi:creatinine amidohydrolase